MNSRESSILGDAQAWVSALWCGLIASTARATGVFVWAPVWDVAGAVGCWDELSPE